MRIPMRTPMFLFSGLALACTEAVREPGSKGDGSPPDNVSPVVDIRSPAAADEVTGSVSVQVQIEDKGDIIAVRMEIDGVTAIDLEDPPWAPVWDTTGVPNGEHDITILAADEAGNIGSDTVRVVVLDPAGASPDLVSIITPPAGAVVCGDVPVTVYVSEPATQVYILVDASAQDADNHTPFDWEFDSTKRENGAHTLTAVAELASGLLVSDRIDIEIQNGTEDTGGADACDEWPGITLAEPDDGEYIDFSEDVEILLTGESDVDIVEFAVDGAVAWSTNEAPWGFAWDTTAVTEGAHIVSAFVTDAGGQRAESRNAIVVDHTPPNAWIVTPADGDGVGGDVTIDVSAEDENGVALVRLSIDGVEQTELTEPPWTWIWDASGKQEAVDIDMRAFDAAGNVTGHDITVIAGDPPTITITDPLDGDDVEGTLYAVAECTNTSGSTAVTFTMDGVEVGVDDRVPYRATIDTCVMDPGERALEATVVDSLGLSATTSVTVNVDQSLTAEILEPTGVVTPTATFSALVADDQGIDTVSFLIDGVAISGTPSPAASPGECGGDCDDLCMTYTLTHDVTDLTSGDHFVDVSVLNDDGESVAASATFTVERDADGDGSDDPLWGGDDCDDADASIRPGGTETCDGVDEDCDGSIDEDFDADADGYADETACSSGTDCDDADADVNPGAAEICDGVDNDCDGHVDVTGGPTVADGAFDAGTLNVSASDELRGNVYVPSRDLTLTTFEVDMDPGASGTTFAIYEAIAETGTYTLLASSDDASTGSDAWYESETLDISLESGHYYLLAVGSTDAMETRQDRSPTLTEDASMLPIGAIRYTAGAAPTLVTTNPDATRLYSQQIHVEWTEDDDTDVDGDGQNEWCGDCDDADATVFDGADEECDGFDNDCDGTIPADEVDADADGDLVCDADCDDADATRFPSSPELCDGIDNDCDGDVAGDEADLDEDGVAGCQDCSSGTCVMDCDDTDPSVVSPNWYADLDGDGFGDDTTATTECPPPAGYIRLAGDCDDDDASANEGAVEICDAVDNDCNGVADDGFDDDGDGVGSCDDCDDTDPAAYPGATEICGDAVDNDCDGRAPGCRWSGAENLYDASTVFYGEAAGDASGGAADGGDMDDDGVVDVLVGGASSDSAYSDAGAAWLIHGPFAGAEDLGGTSAVRMYGERSGDSAGYAVSIGEDLDGDAYNDAIVSAPNDDDAGSNGGAVYIVSGRTATNGSLGAAGWKIEGEIAGDGLGYGVSAPGDSSGDGDDDVFLGAPYYDAGASAGGGAFVFFGPVTGDTDASAADAILEGERASDNAGMRVAGAGDVDGDGLIDLLVGATGSDTSATTAGAVYLILGPPSSASLSAADAKVTGRAASDALGTALANAGDIDGDGRSDFILGSTTSDLSGSDAGSAWLFTNVPTGTVSVSTADAIFTGEATGDHAGSSVTGPGDLDADGYGEVLIGASAATTTAAGMSYLLYGPLTGTMSLAAGDAAFEGEAASDASGALVTSPGDADGDGVDDMLIGATASDLGGAASGAAYLVTGAR